MLILVAGATGNVGKNVVRSALRRGHRVRALGRTPNNLPEDLHKQIESFVRIDDFDDRSNLDAGCKGADAVICAYAGYPIVVLDGQLALLRAAERAGVRRFHAVSWNLDWEDMALGTIESYDAMISFAQQAKLTSAIKPLYVFCGALAMTLFGVPGAGALEGDSAMWVRTEGGGRKINCVGPGDVVTPFAVEADVADFSVALTTSAEAEKGGYYRFCSDEFTLQEMAETYTKVRGGECSINTVMDVESCKAVIDKGRADATAAGDFGERWHSFIGLVYAYFFATGTCNSRPVDAERFPDVHRTTLEEYIRGNDWI